ncbi:MAG: extracellular solute-binding protein [Lachnospiraceae bacterium]|nr:extracellular solute-binding protein [Lachnospiraceae bacterium]
MNKKRFVLGILMTTLFLFILAGCQKKDADTQETSVQEPQEVAILDDLLKEYDATFQELKIASSADIYHICAYGDKVFYRDYDEALAVWYVKRLDAATKKSVDLIRWSEEESEDEKWSVQCITLTKDGNLLALLGRLDAEEQYDIGTAKGYVLAEYDLDGNQKETWSLEEEAIPSKFFSFCMGVDGDGNIAISSNETMVLIADGKKKGEIHLEDGANVSDYVRSTMGSLYVSVYSGMSQSVRRVDFGTYELVPIEGTPMIIGAVGEIADGSYAGMDHALLVSDGDSLYLTDLNQGKTHKIVNWEACGISGMEVRGIQIREGKVYVSTLSPALSRELAILTPVKEGKEKAEGPKVLRYAVAGKPTVLANIVSGYNRSQKQYRVEFVDYSYGAGWQDRMVADMLGDNPPDLVDMTLFFTSTNPTFEDFLNQGYVDDLTPYLERNGKVNKDDIIEKVMEMVTLKKGIPAIPTTVMIDTMIVSRTEFGDRMGWTVEELMAYAKAHPESQPVDHCCRGDFNYIWFYPNLESFVDFGNKRASFDCQEFREMLEYAHSYPVSDGSYHPYSIEQFLCEVDLESVFDVQMVRNRYFGKTAGFIGYPSLDGEPLFFLKPEVNGATPAICSRSQEKEGAWDFIEYVLSQNPITLNYNDSYIGIPTNKKYLQENIEALADEDGPLKSGAFQLAGFPQTSYDPIAPDEETWYRVYPFTEEEEEILYSFLNGATVRDQRIYTIWWEIVYEELGGYYADQKSIDQTIDAIQSRVQLFLKEQ